MKRQTHSAGRSIGTRLLTAQALVLIASISTAAVVAAVVGPPLFHQHLIESGHTENSPELIHIEMAFRQANLVALGFAVIVAIACSLIVSWYLARRIQRPLSELAVAAADMADGHYDIRLATTGAGPELDAVTTAFNTMAEQLEHTEDTRRRLLSDLGHEMRTPLSTVRAYLESLDDGVRVWDAETRDILHDQVARLSLLASDVADVAAAEEGQIHLQLKPVNVADLLESAVSASQTAYENAGVILEIDQLALRYMSACTVHADERRLGQVLINLLGNALRHSPSGQTVTVSARASGTLVEVSVTDRGDGIPAEQLTHVFERFYRGDSARHHAGHGSGIGLTISKALIEAHHGRISIESDGAGTGTKVTFTIPAL